MRLQGLDIARFVAFLGMVLVNFRIAAEVADNGDWAATFTHLLEGRAAALFVVLAGVGIALAHPTASVMARRGLFLVAIGLLNQVIFEADILHYYGVYFLAAIPALNLSARGLLIATVAVLFVSLLALIELDYEAGWNWQTFEYTGFWTPLGFLRNLLFNGWHPVFPWLCFLLFGLFLGRFQLQRRAVQVLLLSGGLIATLVVASLSSALSTSPELEGLVGLSPIPPGPLYILAGIATSCTALGAILLLTPVLQHLKVASIFAVAGRQTLTLYVVHILIGMGLLEFLGRLDGSIPSIGIFVYSIGFVGLCIAYTWFWQSVHPRGPIETLMRRVTT